MVEVGHVADSRVALIEKIGQFPDFEFDLMKPQPDDH